MEALRYRFDGAFGTYYYALTGENGPCERANLAAPERVLRIHREYIDAGANALLTNTYGANPWSFPNENELRGVIGEGLRLARTAGGAGAAVFADIGPIPEDVEDEESAYVHLAELFMDAGADRFFFETMDRLTPLLPAVRAIRQRIAGAEIGISFAASQDGYTTAGENYAGLIRAAWDAGADIAGINCACGPSHMIKLIRNFGAHDKPLSAIPNSGYPKRIGGRLEYRDNPDYFAEKLELLRFVGADVLGGCCGTTPMHMKKAYELLDETIGGGVPVLQPLAEKPQPIVRLSGLKKKLDRGQFVILAELDPPAGTEASRLLRFAKQFKAAGADAVTVPDSPLARVRADSLQIASKVQREVDIEAIPHLTCRDRNQIATRGALIAAQIDGVQDVLVITGDPASGTGDKNVFCFYAARLIETIANLNGHTFSQSPFFLAGALNVHAANFDVELKRAQKKIDAGAHALITQPVFSEADIRHVKKAREILGTKLIVGILPVAGYKNAIFLNNEVPGIEVPEELVLLLKDKSKEEAKEIVLAHTKSVMDSLRAYCDGFYLMTPLKRIDLTKALIAYAKGGMVR